MKLGLPSRAKGVLLIAAAGGTTMLHRIEYQAARHEPAQLAEFALALATFMLASTGILLLIHGGKLFARDQGGAFAKQYSKAAAGRLVHGDNRLFAQRRAMALIQSRRVIGALHEESSRYFGERDQHDPRTVQYYVRTTSNLKLDLERLRRDQ